MSVIYFTEKEKQLLYEGLNSLMVDRMQVLNQTKSTPWIFPDPEGAREQIYEVMDDIEMLLDKLEVFS